MVLIHYVVNIIVYQLTLCLFTFENYVVINKSEISYELIHFSDEHF